MLALAVLGIDYEPRRLSNSRGDQKNDAFLTINPRGRVPVFVNGRIVVRETNAILAYLDALHTEHALFGTTPEETGQIWQTVSEAGERLRDPISNVTRPIFRGRAQEMAEELQSDMTKVHTELHDLDKQVASSPFISGNRLSAADLVAYPVIMQLHRGATREGAVGLDLGFLPLEQTYPNIAAWTSRIESIEKYDEAYPPHWR